MKYEVKKRKKDAGIAGGPQGHPASAMFPDSEIFGPSVKVDSVLRTSVLNQLLQSLTSQTHDEDDFMEDEVMEDVPQSQKPSLDFEKTPASKATPVATPKAVSKTFPKKQSSTPVDRDRNSVESNRNSLDRDRVSLKKSQIDIVLINSAEKKTPRKHLFTPHSTHEGPSTLKEFLENVWDLSPEVSRSFRLLLFPFGLTPFRCFCFCFCFWFCFFPFRVRMTLICCLFVTRGNMARFP